MPLFKHEIVFSAENPLGIARAKLIIENEINERLPGKKIKRYWEADTFKLVGMGADGGIEVLEQQIKVHVTLKPPLLLMKDRVEKNLHEVIEKISAADEKTELDTQSDSLFNQEDHFLWQQVDGVIYKGVNAPAIYLTNFGHIYSARPKYIIQPNTIADLKKSLEFAGSKNLSITIRGNAHSQTTHAINEDGILIDTKRLDDIAKVDLNDNTVWVESGALWKQVLANTYHHQLIPPVLTNNLEATVGGTLSVAGIGVASFKYGTQCDQVEELEVMTIDGEIHRCSRAIESELFWGVLASLGQIGIITKAKLKLRKAKPYVRTYYLLYDDLNKLLLDSRTAMAKGDYFESWSAPCPQGFKLQNKVRKPFAKWFFPLQLSIEFDNDSMPDDKAILADLNPYDNLGIIDTTTPEYLNRLIAVFDLWKRLGTWDYLHPWMETILPEETCIDYIETILANLSPGVNLGGHVLLWPTNSHVSQVPFFMRPQTKGLLIGFGILPAVPPAMWPEAKENLDQASELSMAMQGKRYLSGYLNFSPQQWQEHYGNQWGKLVQLKEKFDPDHRLNLNLINFEK